jgi:small subunit ribosomal protein S9
MPTTKKTNEQKKDERPIEFKGRFISAIGKRKTSTAQVRLYKNGKGIIIVNDLRLNQYFTSNQAALINKVLKLTGHLRDLDFSIKVSGGGKRGQVDAIILGIARALVSLDKELRPALKAKGWLRRDARKKERKKPGLKKARRAPQWAKR